jgi:hypothetical protein
LIGGIRREVDKGIKRKKKMEVERRGDCKRIIYITYYY